MRKTIFTEKPAKGVHGTLLRTIGKGLVLRVYEHSAKERVAYFKKMQKAGKKIPKNDPMYKFIDYNIDHYDMDIIIDEEHASLYETAKGHFIDYDSKTLGL